MSEPMPIAITFRNFQPADCSALAALMTELGYPTTSSDMQERMASIQGSGNYKTILAISGDQVTGMIGLVKNFLWEQNGFYVRIQALVVESTARRQGIGRLLVEHAEQWASDIGASFIALNCGEREERQLAHQFYLSMSFERKSIGYIKRL